MPFQKGQSGNPGGRAKRTKSELDLIAACRKRSPAALKVIEELMKSGDTDTVRLRAAVAILERAYGTAIPQSPASMPTEVESKELILHVQDGQIRADTE